MFSVGLVSFVELVFNQVDISCLFGCTDVILVKRHTEKKTLISIFNSISSHIKVSLYTVKFELPL